MEFRAHHCQQPPRVLAHSNQANSLSSLRIAYFCGEALPAALTKEWQAAAPSCEVVNFYGPTGGCRIFSLTLLYLPTQTVLQSKTSSRWAMPLTGFDMPDP